MKLKSILIFFLIILLLAMILPTLVLCFKMGIEDQEFEDTWLGKMIAQM